MGEAGLAGAAGEHAQAVFTVVKADTEVALVAQAIVGAVGVLAAEEIKVFHEKHHLAKSGNQWTTTSWNCRKTAAGRQR